MQCEGASHNPGKSLPDINEARTRHHPGPSWATRTRFRLGRARIPRAWFVSGRNSRPEIAPSGIRSQRRTAAFRAGYTLPNNAGLSSTCRRIVDAPGPRAVAQSPGRPTQDVLERSSVRAGPSRRACEKSPRPTRPLFSPRSPAGAANPGGIRERRSIRVRRIRNMTPQAPPLSPGSSGVAHRLSHSRA